MLDVKIVAVIVVALTLGVMLFALVAAF